MSVSNFSAIVTRMQHKQMQQDGFKSAFQILIARNISLEKFLIGKPKRIVARRGTINVDKNIDKYLNAAENSGDNINNIDLGAGGSDGNVGGFHDRTQRSADAVAVWRKWSFLSTNIPFGVRGRRRNSMLADNRLTMSTINECNDE